MADVWIGTRGDYIATSFEVEDVSITSLDSGAYSVTLRNELGREREVIMPPELIFNESTFILL